MSIEARVFARSATIDLFRESPIIGWGPGSFRHAFPIFQQNYPDILLLNGRVQRWDYAHNDYVQALAEFGVVGFLFPMLALIWAMVKFCRLGALAHPAFLLMVLGFGLTLAHAWVDFPFGNPGILATFCASWALVLRWAELETR